MTVNAPLALYDPEVDMSVLDLPAAIDAVAGSGTGQKVCLFAAIAGLAISAVNPLCGLSLAWLGVGSLVAPAVGRKTEQKHARTFAALDAAVSARNQLYSQDDADKGETQPKAAKSFAQVSSSARPKSFSTAPDFRSMSLSTYKELRQTHGVRYPTIVEDTDSFDASDYPRFLNLMQKAHEESGDPQKIAWRVFGGNSRFAKLELSLCEDYCAIVDESGYPEPQPIPVSKSQGSSKSTYSELLEESGYPEPQPIPVSKSQGSSKSTYSELLEDTATNEIEQGVKKSVSADWGDF